MSKNNIKIILVLLAIAMVAGVYMYVFKPNRDDTESIKAETETLEAKLNDLKEKDKHRDQYLEDTQSYYERFDVLLADYPAALNQEVSIMFMKGVEDARNNEFSIQTAGLGRPEQFYSLGGTAQVPEGYVCTRAAFPISYVGTYNSLKEYIDYIMAYPYRMNISSINIAYDTEQDIATGSVSMNAYAIAGGDRVPETVDVDVEHGVDNLFLGGADSPSTQSYSYDTDNGAGIVSNNDIMITLNNAANDTAAGIVVSAGGSGTNVTSSANSVETVELHVYEQDGKKYADYAIGDDSYTVEITSSDVKIYVESAERVDSDDKNGVRLNVKNDTTMVVFVKVSGDDVASPRFSLGSKTGTVKVY